jgi:cellulose synthase/poly-beta-1,6-N-acetylglucosamine synthase-like glycosyltransferase
MTELWMFLLIWGVWILMPIIVDGTDTLVRLFVVLIWGRHDHAEAYSDKYLPGVTVIVPAYNENQVIDRCLNSIKNQDYPHEKLEVIVIDDGSTDGTAELVLDHIDGQATNGNGFRKNGNGNGYLKTDGGKTNGNGNGNGNGHIQPGIYRSKDLKNENGNNGKNVKNGNGNGYLLNGDHTDVQEFNGDITLITDEHMGKPDALNLGVKHMNGSDLVVTIDSDVVLAPDAIRNMACAFLGNSNMAAATGHIEISEEIVEERDEFGNLILDEEGRLITRKLGIREKMLAKCQFLEYLDAFRLGRQFQATIHSTYILAGAFSAFRRDILEKTPLYRPRTVSEDFDLTVDIHKTKSHVGYVPDAKAFLEPVITWTHLYSQRVRWCRGQLEVCGAHRDMIGNREYGPVGWFGLPQMLITDHTLAFPRLMWTFIILLFPLFGYPVMTILLAIGFMYIFYIGLGILQTFSAFTIVDEVTKKKTESALPWILVLPVYRLIVFYFRMSGFLRTMVEPAVWDVKGSSNGRSNGNGDLDESVHSLREGMKHGLFNGFKNGHKNK